MTLPYLEPVTPREPSERVVPEPPRRGEDGGPPCGICTQTNAAAVWSDDRFTVHPPVQSSLPGTLWIASREHADALCDLAPETAAAFGPLLARLERAMLQVLPDVARIHLYRWGDGGAHFHVWLMPRPLGMMEAMGCYLPLWEDALPAVPDEECRAAAERVVAAL